MSSRAQRTYERILHEATALFRVRGYQRTRLQEVAEAVGVSEPAVYRYFRSKDALFDAVLRRAAGDSAAASPAALPWPTPEAGATLGFLEAFFGRSRRLERLEATMSGRSRSRPTRDELEGVFEEIFLLALRYRDGVQIMRASALEAPELAAVYERELTAPLVARVAEYLGRRAAQRRIRLPTLAPVAAALVVNLIGVHAAYQELLVPVGAGSDDERRAAVTQAALAMFEPEGGYR